jgi:uncharacterized membrane protein (UPF0182 family)
MTSRVHIKFGLATAALLMLLTLVFYFARLQAGGIQPLIFAAIIIAGVIFSCLAFKRTFPEAPFNEVFFNGFRTTAIIAFLLVLFAIIFVFTFPDFKAQAIEGFRQKEITEASGKADLLAKVEDNVGFYKSRFLTMFIGINMMIAVLAGLVGSVAGAFFSKNFK